MLRLEEPDSTPNLTVEYSQRFSDHAILAICQDLYILCRLNSLLFISYKMPLVELSYAAVKRFIVVLRLLSLQRAARVGQTTLQNINDFDWSKH